MYYSINSQGIKIDRYETNEQMTDTEDTKKKKQKKQKWLNENLPISDRGYLLGVQVNTYA